MTIGLIPCAGTATRIYGIPKALLPINDDYLLGRLVESMRAVDVQGIIGTTTENASFLQRYSKSAFVYVVDKHATMTETVLSCKSFATVDKVVTENAIFGMPDAYIEDDQCYSKLLNALDDGADVAVALFYARPNQHKKVGMCSTLGNQIHSVVDKPANRMHYTHLWGALAWKPAFWDLLQPEYPHVGYALPQAIARGMDVRAVKCDGGYWDCGTWAEYAELTTHLYGRKEASEMQQVYG